MPEKLVNDSFLALGRPQRVDFFEREKIVRRFATAIGKYARAAQQIFEHQEKMLKANHASFYLWRDRDGKFAPGNAIKVQRILEKIKFQAAAYLELTKGPPSEIDTLPHVKFFGSLSQNSELLWLSLPASTADSLIAEISINHIKNINSDCAPGIPHTATKSIRKPKDARLLQPDIQVITEIIKERSDYLALDRSEIVDWVRKRLEEITPGEGAYKNYAGHDREEYSFIFFDRKRSWKRKNLLSKIDTVLADLKRQAGGQAKWTTNRETRKK